MRGESVSVSFSCCVPLLTVLHEEVRATETGNRVREMEDGEVKCLTAHVA